MNIIYIIADAIDAIDEAFALVQHLKSGTSFA